MKIAFVEPNPSYGGGSEQVCLDLARGLASRGHQIVLFYGRAGSMLPDYLAAGIKTVPLRMRAFGWRTFFSSLYNAWSLARAVKLERIDVLFSSDIQYMRVFALSSWMASIPLVYHLGLPSTHREWSWSCAYRQIRLGVAPSGFCLETWARDGWPRDTLVVIPNGVNTEIFCPPRDRVQMRRQLGLPEQKPIINFTGRLIPEKGIATLLSAFARVIDELPTALLVLVGSPCGNGHVWQELAIGLGLSRRQFLFVGERSDRQDYMAAADVVVVPSEWDEPFGLVAIEAMACGIPVVVARVGILHDLIGNENADRVFEKGDVDSLADILLKVFRKVGDRGGADLRNRAIMFYSLSAFSLAYEGVLAKSIEPLERERQR